VKYFLDNDISPRFAAMLRSLGVDVAALRDLMPADTKDRDLTNESELASCEQWLT
jgi:predicted nuclease of predicted toxin-antitoxin system